jgi:hypothetical protein
MERTRKRTLITTAVAGAGAAAALGIALAASPAQAEDPTPNPSASSSAPATGKPDREAARAERQDELATALAAELGIDKAKVAAALEKVQAAQQADAKAERTAQLKTRLDEAVKAGTLTADEAAAILKAAEAGVLPQGGPGGHRGGPGR